jgi:hypothetical protein
VSFLSQLKAQASAVQAEKAVAQTQAQIDAERRLVQTEIACKAVWEYLSEAASQLNILVPEGPRLSVDGKTFWPTMKLVDFRVDARKKLLGDREVYASIGLGWEILPLKGKPALTRISVNFLPELQKVEARLSAGGIQHERTQVRHPEKQSVQAISFEYRNQARGSISVTPDHDKGTVSFRFWNVSGLATQTGAWPADMIDEPFLDELAKLLVSQPSLLFPMPD